MTVEIMKYSHKRQRQRAGKNVEEIIFLNLRRPRRKGQGRAQLNETDIKQHSDRQREPGMKLTRYVIEVT